jgi:glutathione S-transferase
VGGRPLFDRRHPSVPVGWRFVDTLQPAPATYPNLSAHYERMMARLAVQKTLKAEAAIGYNLPR